MNDGDTIFRALGKPAALGGCSFNRFVLDTFITMWLTLPVYTDKKQYRKQQIRLSEGLKVCSYTKVSLIMYDSIV